MQGKHCVGPVNYLPNLTMILAPLATCVPGAGDCSWANPLPTTPRSSPLDSASSIAERTDLPTNDGTTIPPCSTSRTTVPFAGGGTGASAADGRVGTGC